MFDSIHNVGDFLSPHWLAEVFPRRLKDLHADWAERSSHGKAEPWHELIRAAGSFGKVRARLAEAANGQLTTATRELHDILLTAAGYQPGREDLQTLRDGLDVTIPLAVRCRTATGEALHVLEAHAASCAEDLLDGTGAGRLLDPANVQETAGKTQHIQAITEALSLLFLTDDAPRYVLVVAGGWLLLTDAGRWAEGRYLALDAETALARRDDKRSGELAWHAGLWSADVLLPRDQAVPALDEYTKDSVKHAVGVSKDLREGLRHSVELLASEALWARRERGDQVEGIADLPRDIVRQSLRFLYRILFLLYAEARPELGVLPIGDPDYAAGYGMDRLRELTQVPLTTPQGRDGHHIHDSLRVLFRLVNSGHRPLDPGEADAGEGTADGPRFEPLRSDLFDPAKTPLIDGRSDTPEDRINLRNEVLQRILQLLLLSKQQRGTTRGYVSYAQLGINQLGAVYEGLMAYSGRFADEDLAELAPDGDPSKGTWVVPVSRLHEYDERHYVYREDPLTGERRQLRHPRGSFVFRLSGRDRQRSASYYTPEVLTRCVVKHALAELLDQDGPTPAQRILELTVCEPALGSGAFLNEAISQLARAYLERRQAELAETIPPDEYAAQLQKVKAHLALHQCYGVDLNQTAVELAEVSLWLNVMHPGLRGPWFGLHLRRGNSLIGARRAVYDLAALARDKHKWLDIPPEDRPLSGNRVCEGEIHHFLLPAHGWGAVASDKRAKELAPSQAERLHEWARAIKKRPSTAQTKRLQALARRVERLWDLARRRLEISEEEVARRIDVWRAEQLPISRGAVTREQVESELNDPDSPYQRLRLAMDAWCTLWFWPVNATVGLPPTLDEWIATLEGLLGTEPNENRGRRSAGEDRLGMFGDIHSFAELREADYNERTLHNMTPITQLLVNHPWLGTVREIADQEGFFHWELDFAHIFTRGGFDLQVGNPPWVRPIWEDSLTLAEIEPFFRLTDKIPEEDFRQRRDTILGDAKARISYLADLASWAGLNEHLGSPTEHPILTGIKTNLYLNFMDRTWRSAVPSGIIGLIHPEGHFTDPKAGSIRAQTYVRLRRHWEFRNEASLFEEVQNTRTFGISVYGAPGPILFKQIAGVHLPATVDASLEHDGSGEPPDSKLLTGQWDRRPHSVRLVTIDKEALATGAALFDPPGTPPEQARLVRPLTVEHLAVFRTIAGQPRRMADLEYHWSSGWNETTDKRDGFFEWLTADPSSWEEVILQGPHFAVATPFAKQPNNPCQSNKDYTDWNLEILPARVIPRTNYQRACEYDFYRNGLTRWDGAPYTSRWRLVWRRMVDPATERSFNAALIPKGAAHVNTVNSLALRTDRETALTAGLWASIPLDYLVKVSGKFDVQDSLIAGFPAPLEHSAGPFLLLRILRLNCLTKDYALLWQQLFEASFLRDGWTSAFADWRSLQEVTSEWTMALPLRTEYERRAALVEIDALAALMLGISADQLCAIYRAQFGVLRQYEHRMFFDAQGRKIAKETHARGWKQQPGDYELAEQWYAEAVDDDSSADRPLPAALRDRYRVPLIKPDREAEMRAAYSEFERRLAERSPDAPATQRLFGDIGGTTGAGQ
ncbi:MAG: Eco57I restriction-modification methylase domain-containing protein [Streptosporangiaceae bacterium]